MSALSVVRLDPHERDVRGERPLVKVGMDHEMSDIEPLLVTSSCRIRDVFAQHDFVDGGIGGLEAVGGRHHHPIRHHGPAALEEQLSPALGLRHVDLDLPRKLTFLRLFPALNFKFSN